MYFLSARHPSSIQSALAACSLTAWHCLRRLYSCWKNKYVDMPGTCKPRTDDAGNTRVRCDPFFDNWVRLGRKMYAHAGMLAPESDNAMLQGVTWPMFLDAVLSRAVQDKHWWPQVPSSACCTCSCVPSGGSLHLTMLLDANCGC